MRIITLVAVLVVLSGCTASQIDAFNRSYEKANASGVPNSTYRQTLRNSHRDYVTNPMQLPQHATPTNPTWGMQGQTQGGSTQSYMINTPQGIEQATCTDMGTHRYCY